MDYKSSDALNVTYAELARALEEHFTFREALRKQINNAGPDNGVNLLQEFHKLDKNCSQIILKSGQDVNKINEQIKNILEEYIKQNSQKFIEYLAILKQTEAPKQKQMLAQLGIGSAQDLDDKLHNLNNIPQLKSLIKAAQNRSKL